MVMSADVHNPVIQELDYGGTKRDTTTGQSMDTEMSGSKIRKQK